MATLIDPTYFDTQYCNIPDGGDFDNRQAVIDNHQDDILEEILGYGLAKLVIAYDSGTSEQRIKDLVEGKEFISQDTNLKKWIGFINSKKESIIAYHCFDKWMRSENETTTNNGVVKVMNENSIPASATNKLVTAQNRMVDLINVMCDFLTVNITDYPEWVEPEYVKPINFMGI